MIKNHLKSALRNLLRNKLYTALNVAGLTFGISCFLLIGLYLFDELTFDQQHENADRIYRVVEHKNVSGEETIVAAAGYKLAEESKKTISEVENVTRMQRIGRGNIFNPEKPENFQESITVTDERFLNIFDFQLLHGNKKTALKEPNSIVVTEDLAKRLFKTTDVLGRLIKIDFMDNPIKVTGVVKNHARNSSFDFSLLLSSASFENNIDDLNKDWLSNNFSVYMLLKPNANAEAVASKMKQLVQSNFTPPASTKFHFSLQPLTAMHLHSENIVDGARNINVDAMPQGSSFYVRLFSFVALFVLLLAGINYMNLTTARASNRLKEIGIRKTMGATKGHLIKQLMIESLIVTFVSFLVAMVIVELMLPSFNNFVNKQLSLTLSSDYRIWVLSIVFVIATGLLSGSYPSWLLSRSEAVSLLKGKKIEGKNDLSFRKGLIIFQFTISTLMIVGTIVLFLQVRYLKNANLGFNKDLLVVIDVNNKKARSNYEAVKSEMAKLPAVKNVSVTSRVPGEWKMFRTVKIKNGASPDEPKVAYSFGVDKDFIKTYEVQMLKGRSFDTPTDSTSVVLNETAAKMLGVVIPEGQMIEVPSIATSGSFSPLEIPFKAKVIGIVKDFHFQSLRDQIEPLVLTYHKNPFNILDYYSVKIAPDHVESTLDKLKAIMLANDETDPFEYHFLDQQLARFYIEDERRETLLVWMALASIFIACLGLFGLATYSAHQRIKEIGIRKVLGASTRNLTSLLTKDFLKLVLIANAIAFPIGWLATKKWLQEYAYHIELSWWIFALAGIFGIIIALFTVSFQAVKAALANPIKSLRTE